MKQVLLLFYQQTRQPVVNPIQQVLRAGSVVGQADSLILRTKSGAEMPVDGSAAPIRNERGDIVGVVLVFRDVTERRQAEAELRLRAEELVEADQRKNEFLAMLAHELRNPLAPIRNAAQVVQRLGSADPNLQWAGDVINRQVRQAMRLVEDLLDVTRISRGKVQLQRQPVVLAEVVAQAVESSRPLIDARRHHLGVSVPPEPLWVEADPTRLAQVVTNLLNNAAKYTEEGGQIWLTVERSGEEVVLRVKDTGIGITQEMLSRVFDLFAQGERALNHAQGGLGIGLGLVKRLVEMHGGSVHAFSAGPGKGSEFVVHLPAWEPQQTLVSV